MKGLRWSLALLAAAAAGLVLWRLRRFPDPPRARLAILVSGDGAPGLQALLQDLAESQDRWVVVPADAPAPRLRLQARREGRQLRLEGDLGGAPLPACAGSPAEALAALAGRLGLRPPGPSLLPAEPGRAWELLDLAGRSQDETSRDLLRRAEALVAAEPRCAEARLALATLETRFLVERVDADTLDAQQACETNLQAALDLAPDLPRLVELAAIHYSDVGRQREALARLRTALRRHPGALPLDNGLAYAARTSGLLDLADRALER